MYDVALLVERLESVSMLYVEDDKVQREINAKTFEKLFKTIDVAEDGIEGVKQYKKYFAENDTFYDLIITDILMPNLDGMGMSEKIMDLNPEQTIVVLSAHNEMEHLRTLMDLGVDAYMNKPIEFTALCHVMEKVSQRIYIKQKNEQYLREIERLNRKLMKKNQELERKVSQSDEELSCEIIPALEDISTLNEETLEVRANLLDDIPDLQDIYEDLDHIVLVCIEKHMYSEHYKSMSSNLRHFATVLSYYALLNPLARKMEQFANMLRTQEPPAERLCEIFNIIESFISSLGNWLRVWEENKINDISYFNDSMINDIETIINLWNNVEVEGEIEFF